MFSTFDYIAMIHEERLSLTNLTERDNILRNLKKKKLFWIKKAGNINVQIN